VTVSFQSAPATGTLELSGSGSASVSVSALDSTTVHVFTGVEMPADGEAIDLSATFTDVVLCVFTESNAGTAPVSCAPTCSDGIQNGDETGVDCGGSSCLPCTAPGFTDYCKLGLDIDGESAGDESGRSVSLSSDGSVVAIGAPLNSSNSGHVRVYEWDGAAWSQRGVDIDGELAGDESGRSVSLSSDGSVLAIGAPDNYDNGAYSGHVRVYEWDGTAWSQRGDDIDGEAAYDRSGLSVSLSSDGSVLAIGAPSNYGNGTGHVRVYEWNGAAWTQRGLDIDGESAYDFSGSSVSLSSDGSVLAIGAPSNDGNGDGSGHVRVYEWDGAAWSQRGVDIDGESAGDQSGYSVSLSSDGNVLAIGAPYNDDNGVLSGHVRVYEWDGTAWSQKGDDMDGEAAGNFSGVSVSLSSDGSVLAIGADRNDGNGESSGHVRVYEWDGAAWSQRAGDIDGQAAHRRSGSSVSLSSDGSVLAIGAPIISGGQVRVYEACMSTCQISAIAVSNLSSCTPGTDTYTADVTVSFQSAPATGTLELSGSGSASVSVSALDSTTIHVFTGVEMPADGEAIDLFATFTDVVPCVFTESNAGTAPVSCAPTCSDGIQNGDETGVDCGGSNCPPCAAPGFTDYCKLGLDIDGESAGDESGGSVSLSSDGSVVAIGALGNSGHVRVYEWDGTAWSQRGGDIYIYGESVSLSSDGSVLAIGAPAYSGLVRVYEWDGAAWTQRGADIDGESAYDFSGSSVSLSSDGDVLAIGAPGNDGNGSFSGHVRVYEWDGAAWSQRGVDIDGESAYDYSGSSVSLSSNGSVVAIGADGNDGNGTTSGHVRVYEWDGAAWSQRGGDIEGESAGDRSGHSVSLSSDGSVLAIGALGNDGNGEYSGHVRVYEWDGAAWSQRGVDLNGESAGDQSGYSVSLSSDGSVLAIGGVPYNDGNGDSGQVRVYEWEGTEWLKRGVDIDVEGVSANAPLVLSLSSDGGCWPSARLEMMAMVMIPVRCAYMKLV